MVLVHRPTTQTMNPKERLFNHWVSPMWSALRVTTVYASFGILWILFSDAFVDWLFAASPETITLIQSIKGILYVIVTSLLLYVLIRYETSRYQQKHNDFEKLFHKNPQPMWIYDLSNLSFLEVNHAAVEKYAYSRDEFLKMTIKDIRPHEAIPALLEAVQNTRNDLQDTRDWQHRGKTGQLFTVRIFSHRLNYAEKDAVLVTVLDVTERRQIEKQRLDNEILRLALEKEKEGQQRRDRFVSMISHEFRNPLATISASVGIMQKFAEKLDEARRGKHLKTISEQSQRLMELLDEMLSILRMEASTTDFQPEVINLAAFCQQVIEGVKNTYVNTPTIEFICEVSIISAEVDIKLMRRILENMLTNAIKYSPNGGLIRVQLSRLSHIFVLRISDEGIGIPPENLPKLFEPFFRANNTGRIQGTGLGLAIVKQAVELHAGMIDVESAESIGTTFEIRMPLRQSFDEFEQMLLSEI
jgi:PAS domain S-box-containing protein